MTQIAVWDNVPAGYLASWLENSAWKGIPTGLYPYEGSATQWKELLEQGLKFSPEIRQSLVSVMSEQSKGMLSSTQHNSLQLLSQSTTFTVTTGQQIHFDLGPAYVFFKITSAITLCTDLKQQYPQYDFVPVFWMATEDHDFQEIATSKLFNKTWTWNDETAGPVGRKSVHALSPWLEWVSSMFENIPASREEIESIKKIFDKPDLTLSEAIQHWVLRVFQHTNLLVLNPDHVQLKQWMVPMFKREIVDGVVFSCVEKQNEALKAKGLIPEAHVRGCNLFYLSETLRERLEWKDDKIVGVISRKAWNLIEILKEIESNPERFSPNVLFRPAYQQTILPNIAYVAGPSEYKYWLQIPTVLQENNVLLPALILRKSGVFLGKSQTKKLDKWGISLWELFHLNPDELRKSMLEKLGNEISLNPQITVLNEQLQAIYTQLFQWKSAHLKSLKKQGDQLMGDLTKIEKLEQESIIKNRLTDSEWDALLLLKSTLADIKSPQERNLHWFQEYLQDPAKFNSVIELICGKNEITAHPTATPTKSVAYQEGSEYFKYPFYLM